MMSLRSFVARLAACCALAVPVAFASDVAAPSPAAYGEALRLEEATPIASILAEPRRFEGERVRVEGEIDGVCRMKGCWMTLRQDDAVVRIKVDDGVIVFPSDAVGLHAAAEGVVELHEMTRGQYVEWRAHLAEELDQAFDPETVGEGPYEMVQIRGAGAAIAGR